MAWKIKEKYIGKYITNFRQSLCSLKSHHIDNLRDEIKNKYFEQTVKAKKKNVGNKEKI